MDRLGVELDRRIGGPGRFAQIQGKRQISFGTDDERDALGERVVRLLIDGALHVGFAGHLVSPQFAVPPGVSVGAGVYSILEHVI